MTDPLYKKKCRSCEGGVEPLNPERIGHMILQVPEWQADAEASVIARTFTFKNFKDAILFVNKVARVAEDEDHHPDIFVHGYKNVTISVSTHAIGGLSENDFIVAAKIDAI